MTNLSRKDLIRQHQLWKNWVNQFHISGLTTSKRQKSILTNKVETFVNHEMIETKPKGRDEFLFRASALLRIYPYAPYSRGMEHRYDAGVDHWTLWILGREYSSNKSLDELVAVAQKAIKGLTYAKADKIWGRSPKLLKVDFERMVKWANSNVKVTSPKSKLPGKIKVTDKQKHYTLGPLTSVAAAKLNANFVKHTNKKGYVYNKFTLSDIYNDVRKGQYVLVTDHKSKFYRTKEVGKGFDRKSKDLPPIVGYSIARVFKIDQRHPEADAFLVVQDGRMRWCPEFVAILP
jgi:hypothetical protein